LKARCSGGMGGDLDICFLPCRKLLKLFAPRAVPRDRPHRKIAPIV
jgi:hypothetical protein